MENLNLRSLIDQLIKKLDAKVAYMPLQQKGKAITPLKLVIVNDQLPEAEALQVILHELEHIKQHHHQNQFESPRAKIKKEAQAEHGRIKIDVGHYITHTPKEHWNSLNFLNYFKISSEYEKYVSEQFQDLLNQEKND